MSKKFERRSLLITTDEWAELEAIAVEMGAVAQTGSRVGQASWRTLVKKIANRGLEVKHPANPS